MQQTLSQHIAALEAKIVSLRSALRREDLSSFDRAERELALMNAQEALQLFRKAYEVEQKVL